MHSNTTAHKSIIDTTLAQRAHSINLFEEAAERHGQQFLRMSYKDQAILIEQIREEKLNELSHESRNVCSIA